MVVQKADFHSLERHARDDSATSLVRWVYTGHVTSRCHASLLKLYGKWSHLVYRLVFHHPDTSTSQSLLTQKLEGACLRALLCLLVE